MVRWYRDSAQNTTEYNPGSNLLANPNALVAVSKVTQPVELGLQQTPSVLTGGV